MQKCSEIRKELYNLLIEAGVDIKKYHDQIKKLVLQHDEVRIAGLQTRIKQLERLEQPKKSSFTIPKNVKSLYKI